MFSVTILNFGVEYAGSVLNAKKMVLIEEPLKKLPKVFDFETSTCHVTHCFRQHRTGMQGGFFVFASLWLWFDTKWLHLLCKLAVSSYWYPFSE